MDFAKSLFDNLGRTLIINEDMMDAATAISGSGPGYFYDFIKGKSKEEIKFLKEGFITSLIEVAHSIGFSMVEAELLTVTTTHGSMELLSKTKLSAEQLRNQVASKGGTTEAALEVLHMGGSLEEAVKAALNRAYELTKKG